MKPRPNLLTRSLLVLIAASATALAQVAVAPMDPPEPDMAPEAPPPVVVPRIEKLLRRAPAKALVIRTSATDAKTQSNLEEDLSVMARILEKAVTKDSSDGEGPQASGIQLFFSSGGDSPRNLYLEGYGAVFMLNVQFPLLPPPTKPDEAKPPSETNSTWEEAKRELYGQKDEWPDVGRWLKLHSGSDKPQPYDARKVERLQRSVLEALKNAANIRNLKSDETIIVCVFGGASGRNVATKNVRLANVAAEVRIEQSTARLLGADERSPAGGQQTVLTLRVKKTDAEAFAKGSIDLDTFTGRAQITAYAAETGGWGGGRGFY